MVYKMLLSGIWNLVSYFAKAMSDKSGILKPVTYNL